MDCTFCKIIRGELPSSKIYEDDDQIAFLDLFPITPGHALLIPKNHHINIFDENFTAADKVYPTLIKLARSIRQATGCEGINIVQNNGEAAGQMVFHSHIHLIPRYANDDLKLVFAGKKQATPEEMADMADKIKTAVKGL